MQCKGTGLHRLRDWNWVWVVVVGFGGGDSGNLISNGLFSGISLDCGYLMMQESIGIYNLYM